MPYVKDPKLSVVGVGHQVPVTCFCLSVFCLNVLNRDVNVIQSINLSRTMVKVTMLDEVVLSKLRVVEHYVE